MNLHCLKVLGKRTLLHIKKFKLVEARPEKLHVRLLLALIGKPTRIYIHDLAQMIKMIKDDKKIY